jgi:hypothetical protein
MQPETSAASRSSQIASSGKNTPEPVRHSEGRIARTIEDQTARLPSDSYLWAAVAAIGTAMVLQATGKKQSSLFVGQWVAPFLLFGVYNKIVKVAGSDRLSRP